MTNIALHVRKRTDSFSSGGMAISVEVFSPPKPGRHPVIVFLHGADGASSDGHAGDYQRFAAALAKSGYVVAFPRYFERTGHGGQRADPFTVLTSFLVWATTVDDAIGFASALPEADATRLGLVGTSLGGTLAIDTAARDPRVKALVDVFGGFPEIISRRVQQLPPTLILHGAADSVVSVADSRRLAAKLTGLGVSHELKVYPTAGHGFAGADETDAIDRTVRFLDTHLR